MTDELAHLATWWHAEVALGPPALGRNVRVVSGDDSDLVTANALGVTLAAKDPGSVTTLGARPTDPPRLDVTGWMNTASLTRDLAYELFPLRREPEQLLAALPASARATVTEICDAADDPQDRAILVGPMALAGAILAYELNPDCLYRVKPLTKGTTAIEEIALEYLRLEPILPVRAELSVAQLLPPALALVAAATR